MNRQNHSPHDPVRARAERVLVTTAALWELTWPRAVATTRPCRPASSVRSPIHRRGPVPGLNDVARPGMPTP